MNSYERTLRAKKNGEPEGEARSTAPWYLYL